MSPEPFFADEDDDELDVEAVEPTGTTGALTRPGLGTSVARRRKMRIYPFGVSRERLEQSAKQLHVPVEISRDANDADAVIALKTFYRRQAGAARAAESVRKPIYVLRTNTVAQMQECLARIFELRDTETAMTSGETSNRRRRCGNRRRTRSIRCSIVTGARWSYRRRTPIYDGCSTRSPGAITSSRGAGGASRTGACRSSGASRAKRRARSASGRAPPRRPLFFARART